MTQLFGPPRKPGTGLSVKEGRAAGGPTLDSSKPTHQWSLVPSAGRDSLSLSLSRAPLVLSFLNVFFSFSKTLCFL